MKKFSMILILLIASLGMGILTFQTSETYKTFATTFSGGVSLDQTGFQIGDQTTIDWMGLDNARYDINYQFRSSSPTIHLAIIDTNLDPDLWKFLEDNYPVDIRFHKTPGGFAASNSYSTSLNSYCTQETFTHGDEVISTLTSVFEGMSGTILIDFVCVADTSGDIDQTYLSTAIQGLIDGDTYGGHSYGNGDIVSMSFGSKTYDATIHSQLQTLHTRGTSLFAAVGNIQGNVGPDTLLYPAQHAEVVAVGAQYDVGYIQDVDKGYLVPSQHLGKRAQATISDEVSNNESTFGSVKNPDIVAPGFSIDVIGSADPGYEGSLSNLYVYAAHGTSFSTPIAAGASALAIESLYQKLLDTNNLDDFLPYIQVNEVVPDMMFNSAEVTSNGNIGDKPSDGSDVFNAHPKSSDVGFGSLDIMDTIDLIQNVFYVDMSSDADGDGLAKVIEEGIGTNPLDFDSDNDGMYDGWEYNNNFNPLDVSDASGDADSDGLTNLEEYNLGTKPRDDDTDNDGLKDGFEVGIGTNPKKSDSDGDTMPDRWEYDHGLNPTLDDASGDADNDGLSNAEEYNWGLYPDDPDWDNEGLKDGDEIAFGSNPKDPDSEDDGVSDWYEYWEGSDPYSAHSDYDSLTDYEEIFVYYTDPTRSDSDFDKMPDDYEVSKGFDPTDQSDGTEDADSDGIVNYKEYLFGYDPIDADTDDDGMPDGWEYNYGFDPLDPSDAYEDADGDSFDNLQEYQEGTDPLDPTSHPPIDPPWIPPPW